MLKRKLVIASRESPLAMAQTRYCQALLQAKLPDADISILPMKTTGDKFLETTLDKIGGKGLFTKELEKALIDKRACLAVHSMKDMPTEHPHGLTLATILKREDARDVFISTKHQSLADIPKGGTVATSSIRRKSQLLMLRPDLTIVPLRGNINSRLKKASQFDGIILAYAGLKRLQLEDQVTQVFSLDEMLPAAGQGALGIECRDDDEELKNVLASLSCHETFTAIQTERAVIAQLGGNCHTPIAAYATIQQKQLSLEVQVTNARGDKSIREKAIGSSDDSLAIAKSTADKLIAGGALALIGGSRA